jgi:hypothetical protein
MKDADADDFGDDSPPSGVTAGSDCNDSASTVSPGEPERCSTAFDDDCDTLTNELNAAGCSTFYADRDGDDYGNPLDSRCYCEASGVYNETDDEDCDDSSNTTFPGAAEFESPGNACKKDDDSDGYGDDSPPSGVTAGEDCDDDESIIYPDATEICDMVDSDCDGSLADGFADLDSDDLPDCVDGDMDGDGVAEDDGDCDDSNAAIYPGATEVVADGIDNDCDDFEACYADADDDGYADSSGSTVASSDLDCSDSGEADAAVPQTDCNDSDDTINPGVSPDDDAFGTGFGTDNDCDGLIDEDTVFDLILADEDVLIFSEMLVNPQGVTGNERDNEWFEVTNVTDSTTLFLDNWLFEMTDAGCTRVSPPPVCDDFVVFDGAGLMVGPGETLLFCFSASTVDSALAASAVGEAETCDYNYGSTPIAGAGSGYHDGNFRLINANTSALTVSVDGIELDNVDHRAAVPPWPDSSDSSHEGQSIMFDGDLLSASDRIDLNDDGNNWCFSENEDLVYDESPVVTDEHNKGTPGRINPTCTDAAPE